MNGIDDQECDGCNIERATAFVMAFCNCLLIFTLIVALRTRPADVLKELQETRQSLEATLKEFRKE